ncbi:hypothetical protein BXZ70DRAFT_949457 [Cristinia sonorae]|uniref:DUF6535 domain-containing protein n=1 Tax=Cristinia sonorae TaxID=1940300 RepID=A0A8K0XMC2_9AGAR|nr:hypothetical protein BXZ70DRAFT_949457 [Cristinia sonorae]
MSSALDRSPRRKNRELAYQPGIKRPSRQNSPTRDESPAARNIYLPPSIPNSPASAYRIRPLEPESWQYGSEYMPFPTALPQPPVPRRGDSASTARTVRVAIASTGSPSGQQRLRPLHRDSNLRPSGILEENHDGLAQMPDQAISPVIPPNALAPSRHGTAGPPITIGTSTRRGTQNDTFTANLNLRALSHASDGSAPAAWAICDRRLKAHDYTMVKSWKEDVDTLLVLTGLISALLTAFIIEFYRLLKPDPQDITNHLLQQLLSQNAGLPLPPVPTFVIPPYAGRVSTFWLASLVFSLSAASFGLLVKQWLQSYISNATCSPRENARIRHFRYEGLVRWRVPEVIALLPILVQVALALFFIGLVDLLWKLDNIVASIVSALVAISLLFVVTTTFTPSFSKNCPHKSPQSLAVYQCTKLVLRGLMRIRIWTMKTLESRRVLYVHQSLPPNRDPQRHRLAILDQMFGRSYHNWRERERDCLRDKDGPLVHNVLASADALLMDDHFLDEVVRTCLNNTDLPSAMNCVKNILSYRADATIAGMPRWKPYKSAEPSICVPIHLVVDILERLGNDDIATGLQTHLDFLEELCRAFPFEQDHPEANTIYIRIFSILSPFLLHENMVICRKVFTILYSVILPHMWDPPRVEPSVIRNVYFLSERARQSIKIYGTDMYYQACALALRLWNTSNMQPYGELGTALVLLHPMIDALRAELLQVDLVQRTGPKYHYPSPSLLAELVHAAQNLKGGLQIAVPLELIEILINLVAGAQYDPSGPGQSNEAKGMAMNVAREYLEEVQDRKLHESQSVHPASPFHRGQSNGSTIPDASITVSPAPILNDLPVTSGSETQ